MSCGSGKRERFKEGWICQNVPGKVEYGEIVGDNHGGLIDAQEIFVFPRRLLAMCVRCWYVYVVRCSDELNNKKRCALLL